jgi:hypothetical protein
VTAWEPSSVTDLAKGPLVEFDADEERRAEILQDVAPEYFDVLPA